MRLRRVAPLLALALLVPGCLMAEPATPAGADDGAPAPTPAPASPSPAPPTPEPERPTPPTLAPTPPTPTRGEEGSPPGALLFREDFLDALDAGAWNVSASGVGGRVESSGGYLRLEKGEEDADGAFAALRRTFDGDVVVEARVWISSLEPRAYSGVSADRAGAVAFFRGNQAPIMSWNTHRGQWESEERLTTIAGGTFYVVRHTRVGDSVETVVLDGGGDAVLGRSTSRAIGDGPLTLHFNLERGGREFMLVDWVEVREGR